MKRLTILAIAACAAFGLSGCQSGGADAPMTKDEMEGLKNPSKEMPKEAIEAMKKAGGPPAPGGTPPPAAGN